MPNTVIPGPESGETPNPEVKKTRRDTAEGKVEGPTAFQRAEMLPPTVRKNGVMGTTGQIGAAPVNRGGAMGKVGVGRRRGVRG